MRRWRSVGVILTAMKRSMISLLAVLYLAVATLHAQADHSVAGAYSFKGNFLGMKLSAFKLQNPGSIYINTGDPTKRVNKKLSRQVVTPLCTDTYQGFEGAPSVIPAGEVYCDATPESTNPLGKVVMGSEAFWVHYWFYKETLFRIEFAVRAADYKIVSFGLESKFGKPTEVGSEKFQNAYGAAWTGETLTWHDGSKSIYAFEGGGNGPAQDRMSLGNASMVSMVDSALGPSDQPHKPTVDF
jgi:hypothetical protein